AGVSGPGGMQLYFNGFLVGSNSFTGSFFRLATNGYFFVGERVTMADAPTWFHGAIDEFRVWSTARTEQQIRDTMFRRLTSKESGLVGLWDFDDGTPRDSSAGQHHGTLRGNAKIVPGRTDRGQNFVLPCLLSGKVTDAQGHPLRNAVVRLLQDGNPV